MAQEGIETVVSEKATACTVDAKLPGFDIRQVVRFLMDQSHAAFLLRPGVVTPIASVERIALAVRDWPDWWTLPWVVAGQLKENSLAPSSGDGLCIREFKSADYDSQVEKLMDRFDWAVFSYFTTFQDYSYTVLVRQPELHSSIASLLPQNAIASCVEGPAFASKLNNATFYDYGKQGWLAYELASEMGNGLPLILTCIWEQNNGTYYRWNNETQEREDFLWYEAPLAKLEQVAEFRVGQAWYQLHRATDFDAYCLLWSMASHDWLIADATLSADTDVARLRSVIAERGNFDVIRSAGEVGSWAYGHIYGGGADEHHAVFHARDAAWTQRIWEYAGASAISRF